MDFGRPPSPFQAYLFLQFPSLYQTSQRLLSKLGERISYGRNMGTKEGTSRHDTTGCSILDRQKINFQLLMHCGGRPSEDSERFITIFKYLSGLQGDAIPRMKRDQPVVSADCYKVPKRKLRLVTCPLKAVFSQLSRNSLKFKLQETVAIEITPVCTCT